MRRSAPASEATHQAYAHWAPLYPPVAHNPLMRIEQQFMLKHWPDTAGKRVLDLAAGSGRYARLLAERGAAEVVAVDFCEPMLRWVSDAARVCASMMTLPFGADSFEVIVSGLALGHAPDVDAWMGEAARVLKAGGTLLYSDFHADAARAQLTRSFTDAEGRNWTVPHRVYTLAEQRQAAKRARLTIEVQHEIRVGIELREEFPGCESFYERWHGLPIVLIVRAGK